MAILPSNYANYLAAAKGDLRKHFPTGVIIVCVTNDEQVIVGSRDKGRIKDRPHMSAEEIKNQRLDNAPEDASEMTVMTTIALADMIRIQDDPTVTLEGAPRKFVAEHAAVPAVITAASRSRDLAPRSR